MGNAGQCVRSSGLERGGDCESALSVKSCDFQAHVARSFYFLETCHFQSELRECALRTTCVLKRCKFRAGAAGARFACCADALRELLARRKTLKKKYCAIARALRRERSPQRVRRDQDTFARRHSESALTRTISAAGLPQPRHIRTAPQRERFDGHDLRRGFAELKTHSHSATARALRHSRSPQRVRVKCCMPGSETLLIPCPYK